MRPIDDPPVVSVWLMTVPHATRSQVALRVGSARILHPVRILVVTSQYHRGAGFPRYATQLASGLKGRGHQVTVLTRLARRGPGDEGIEFRTYRCPSRSVLLTMVWEPRVVTKAIRRIGAEYDAVLAIGMPVLAPVVLFGTGTHRGYFLATMSTLRPSSWRWWFERLRPFHRIVMWWERRMLRGGFPVLVVVGAERFRREYVDLYGLEADRVAVVPLALDAAEFHFDPEIRDHTRTDLGIPPSTRVLVNVAGRGRQKGLDVLVAALDRLPRDREWTALFAGDGSTSAAMHRATAGLRADGRVRLLGRVDDVHSLYCAADLLVFPSRYDPWGLVATEALATGLPVVVSSHAGSSMAVRPGENGVVIDDPNDLEEVARRILEVWDAPFERDAVARTVSGLSGASQAQAVDALLSTLA